MYPGRGDSVGASLRLRNGGGCHPRRENRGDVGLAGRCEYGWFHGGAGVGGSVVYVWRLVDGVWDVVGDVVFGFLFEVYGYGAEKGD